MMFRGIHGHPPSTAKKPVVGVVPAFYKGRQLSSKIETQGKDEIFIDTFLQSKSLLFGSIVCFGPFELRQCWKAL